MFTIPPPGRVEQEGHQVFKPSLDYLRVSSGIAQATKCNPASKEPRTDERETQVKLVSEESASLLSILNPITNLQSRFFSSSPKLFLFWEGGQEGEFLLCSPGWSGYLLCRHRPSWPSKLQQSSYLSLLSAGITSITMLLEHQHFN